MDETAVSLHSFSLGCVQLDCDLSYVGLFANQTSDFTPIPQGTFVAFLSDGAYVTRDPVGDVLCDVLDTCGRVKTTMNASGVLSYLRDNPITHVGWVSSQTCSIRSKDGVATCSSDPTAGASEYFWSVPTVPTSLTCDEWFGQNKLKEMIDGFCSFASRDFAGSTLAGIDLTGMYAPGASFVGVDVSSITVDAANLNGADFTGVDLSDSTFIGADLTDSVLLGAVARRVSFVDAKMVRANLTGAQFTESDFTEADLDESLCIQADFRFTNLLDTSFRSTQCSGALFIAASVIATDFRDSILDGADFNNTTIQGANFGGVNTGEVFGIE